MQKRKLTASPITHVKRRDFLKVSSLAATGLLIGFHLGCEEEEKFTGPIVDWVPNVFLNINNRGEILITAHRSEFGQGVRTSLPMIVADELEADWEKVQIVQAEGDEEKYGNQNTDGSFSIRMFYEPMRKAGAAARMMLEQAAANMWQVDVAECKAENHFVKHTASSKKVSFAKLAEAAKSLDIPKEEDIKLKDKKDFKYIGKNMPIVDLQDIVSGKAEYGMDVKMDGMKIAMIERCPVAGIGVKSLDDTAAKAVDGVYKIYTMPAPGFPTGLDKPLGGVVIVADNTWAAMKARKALSVEWDSGNNTSYDSQDYLDTMAKRSRKKGTIQRESGNVKKALRKSDQVLKSTYRVPHLAHATMEPPCALVHFDSGKNFCEIWAPTQHPQWARGAVAGALGLELDQVKVNVTLVGGGFGRKSKPDFVVEAAMIAKETGFPIKLVWSREDDIRHDFYHALSVQHVEVGLDENKQVQAWHHRTVFPSIGGTSVPKLAEPSPGELGLGFIDLPLEIPNICLETQKSEAQVRIGWLRSVSNIQHAFAICTMMDEIAEARGMDPIENSLDLLGKGRNIDVKSMFEGFENYGEPLEDFPWNTERLAGVVKLVKEKSGWGKSLPEGSGMGFAVHRSFLTYVACVAEVKVDEKGNIDIPEIHYAVDCGTVVNPDSLRNQFEGGAVFGTSIALKSAITLKNGAVEQSNFHDYLLARMMDAPAQVHVHLVESDEKPTGVGEPPVPPVIPAICNAIYKATGQRIKNLPASLEMG